MDYSNKSSARLTTKKIQIGDQVFEASAVIFMEERDRTLKAMSECQPCVLLTIVIPFKDPDAMPKVHRAMEENMDLLAIVLPDGSTKYQLSNPAHLPIAEKIAMQADREGLLRMVSRVKTQRA
jgi:hypothetical protein